LLLQSAWFRPHNRSEDVPGCTWWVPARTRVPDVPGVLMSAKALEQVLPELPPLSSPPQIRTANP
jgi:phytoene desaturase